MTPREMELARRKARNIGGYSGRAWILTNGQAIIVTASKKRMERLTDPEVGFGCKLIEEYRRIRKKEVAGVDAVGH